MIKSTTLITIAIGSLFWASTANAYYVMQFANGCERYCNEPWGQSASTGGYTCEGGTVGSCGCAAIAAGGDLFPLLAPSNENVRGDIPRVCKIGDSKKKIEQKTKAKQ